MKSVDATNVRRRLAALTSTHWTQRGVLWAGGLFIAVFVALAALGIVRSYGEAVADTGHELDTTARVLAEQTARSVQAVDVVLRYVAAQINHGALASMSARELRAYLQDQAPGLVQIDGLLIVNADGSVRASSYIDPAREATVNVSGTSTYEAVRSGPPPGLFIGQARRSELDGRWFFPMVHRLESRSGEFAGAISARGRIDHFQDFYRAVRLDSGTAVALLQDDGALVARHPPVEDALGKRVPSFGTDRVAYAASGSVPVRSVSPIDNIDRFVTIQAVPGYPLAVVVTRDSAVALAPWRAQAIDSAVRTLALGGLAALLLAVVSNQIGRLSAARERYALAVAGSKDGILDWDIVNDRMFTSERAMQIAGVPPGPTLRSRSEWVAMLKVHPEDKELHDAAIRRNLAGETDLRDEEHRVLHPDGVYRWVRVRGMCVRDAAGRAIRMAGSLSDIDAQKRTEHALRQSEARYQLAVDGANQGLWDWDLETDAMFASPRVQELLGLIPSEPLRPRREWIARMTFHPDEVDLVRAAISSHLHGKTGHFEVEFRLRHQSGTWHWYRQRGVALRDERGRPYRMAGSMEDVTEQKNAEHERRRLEGQLIQAKKLEAIGTLAGGIAHDFNNILAAILGNGEMAQAEATPGTPLRRHVDAIVSAGTRAKSLVERILAFSRGGMAGRAPVHVQSVVDEALQLLATSLPPDVHLARRLDAADACVMGDATQIHQLVMNLCTNAIQAMKAKGTLSVTLDLFEHDEGMAATSSLPIGCYVRLRVSDTGMGIPAYALERIFDPFFTTKDIGVGTGLGLSLVHRIVTDLGGAIDVESKEGEGATFTICLPWNSSLAATVSVEEVIPAGCGETILLVDDEEPLVRLGEEVLARLGYEPVGFTSSAAALEDFRASPGRFHAVLSDQAMPDMTGVELARELRSIRPDIPIMLMSGFVSTALLEGARGIGVTDVLAKPLVARDIARSLAGALRP